MLARKNQLQILILLSAFTMMIPYAIQGTLAMASCPAGLDWWICAGDKYAWALRAIVEGVVIGYIARTKTTDKTQTRILWTFKTLLLILIAGTLGPSLYATAHNQTVADSLDPIADWFWTFGLAAYMPLMVGGAAYAYKCQPDDGQQVDVELLQAEFSDLQESNSTLQTQINEMQAIIDDGNADTRKLKVTLADTQNHHQEAAHHLADVKKQVEKLQTELAQVNQAIATWNLLPVAKRIRLIKELCNGDTPSTSALAKSENVAYSTISRVINE